MLFRCTEIAKKLSETKNHDVNYAVFTNRAEQILIQMEESDLIKALRTAFIETVLLALLAASLNTSAETSAMNRGITHTNTDSMESAFIQMDYLNRGETAVIILPEEGIITDISVDKGKAEFDLSLQEYTLVHEIPVNISGLNLIPSGTPAYVEYQNKNGEKERGKVIVGRSSVSTPITCAISPAPDSRGYVADNCNKLVISGTACICEPLRIMIGEFSFNLFASQSSRWEDSAGSWECTVDLTRLETQQWNLISVEYADVNGTGTSMQFYYDP